MTTVKVTGRVDEFKGQPVSPAIEFETTAPEYVSADEIRAAGDWPSDKEIVKWRNVVLKNNARQKKYAEVTKTLQEAYEKSADFKRKGLIDGGKIGEVELATLQGILELKGYAPMTEKEIADYNKAAE